MCHLPTYLCVGAAYKLMVMEAGMGKQSAQSAAAKRSPQELELEFVRHTAAILLDAPGLSLKVRLRLPCAHKPFTPVHVCPAGCGACKRAPHPNGNGFSRHCARDTRRLTCASGEAHVKVSG